MSIPLHARQRKMLTEQLLPYREVIWGRSRDPDMAQYSQLISWPYNCLAMPLSLRVLIFNLWILL